MHVCGVGFQKHECGPQDALIIMISPIGTQLQLTDRLGNARDDMTGLHVRCARWFATSAIVACSLAFPSAARSADWLPARAVEFVVPAGAGGGPDALARLIQRIATEERLIAAPIIVVNKPGGNHTLAWSQLQQHAGDSHVVMIASLGLLTSSLTGANTIDYTEGVLVAQLFAEPIVFTTHPESGLLTARDLATRLRQDASSITFATGGDGVGGANHLALAQAAKAAGADIRKIKVAQFQSSAQATAALLGKHVDVIASPAISVLAHAQAGRLRVLAVSSPVRTAGAMAEVPTWREAGVDAVFRNVRGVIAPRYTPEVQVRYWEQTCAKLVATEAWTKSLQAGNRSAAYLDAAAAARGWQTLHRELQVLLGDLGLSKK